MQTSVIVFPGSNCDRDVAVAFEKVSGKKPTMVWHGDSALPKSDVIVIPGGFSYGDYLRTGAMAAHSPIMGEVIAAAKKGVRVLGICNGFQILCETLLLPGILLRNQKLKFICKTVSLKVEQNDTIFTKAYQKGATIRIPVAHGDGNYFADADTLKSLNDNGQVALRYQDNPNGSLDNIAGIFNKERTIFGLMPHPERANDALLGSEDGTGIFKSIIESMS
ncbi:MAG: phosphoribosylformylglycinamidine synthase subunit PurQ [Alphaproteobacteria bacterium]|nr:phosphoribosylformylglycinamidine synthase subunit PurQ [Alphaproteobacteria bacterium]